MILILNTEELGQGEGRNPFWTHSDIGGTPLKVALAPSFKMGQKECNDVC